MPTIGFIAIFSTTGLATSGLILNDSCRIYLVVMGAYGHSRWQELVMGGATRVMLQSMTVPVLMSY